MNKRETHTTVTPEGHTWTIEPGQESSVEITQNSKGEPRITVKVYHSEIEQAMQAALAAYHQTLDALKEA